MDLSSTTDMWSWLTYGGAFLLILLYTLVYVPKKWVYVVELNIPFMDTKVLLYEGGLRFIPIIPPIILIRNKVFMADETITLNIGSIEGYGSSGKVELKNTSAGVIAQLIIRVTDATKATYNIDDVGTPIAGMPGYKVAAINEVEGAVRALLSGKDLELAMEMVDRSHTAIRDLVKTTNEKFGPDDLHGGVADGLDWGIELRSFTIMDYDLPQTVMDTRDLIISAQKQADAMAIKADGQKRSIITIAEGDRLARQLLGLGQKEQIEAIAQIAGGIDPQIAIQFHLGEKMTEAMKTATLIVTPGSDGGLNIPGAIATAGAILNPGGRNPQPQPPANPAQGSGNAGGGNL